MSKTMKTFTTSITVALLLGSALPALAQDVLIKDAKVVTNTAAGIIEAGDVLVRNGKIAQVAADIPTPDGVTMLDGTGKWVTPGLFAPYSQIGLVEISLESSTNDIRGRESKTSVSDRAVDSFNPKTPVMGNTRVEGITHIASVPGTGMNIFGGTGLIANTSGQFDSIENTDAFISVELGAGGASTAGGSRAAALSQFRAALNDAAAYPARYDGPEDGDMLSRRDAGALFQAARGGMPFLISASRASDLMTIIDLKKEFKIDIVVVGAAEAWMVADELAAAGIKVMVDPHENLPRSFDAVGAREDNILILDAAGVDYAVMTSTADLSHNVRVLSQHAGNAVGTGLSWDKAFASISSTPAKWFGGTSGDLSVGSDATLVIWDGDPLEVTTGAEAVYIDGVSQDMNSRQKLLSDRYNPTNTDARPHKYR
ncbi:amidohydrolase family protein [Fretibacter rubidus]|uniref:amidohydrolase family protein n=1 Tax=Fretibacter rubidus TaxID=570162 RepID=UPI00352BCA41